MLSSDKRDMSLGKSKSTLKKLESLLRELKYVVRYERGNFKSGYCIVNDSNVIIINKFFDVKARINTLIDIIRALELKPVELGEENQETLQKVLKLNIFTKSMVA